MPEYRIVGDTADVLERMMYVQADDPVRVVLEPTGRVAGLVRPDLCVDVVGRRVTSPVLYHARDVNTGASLTLAPKGDGKFDVTDRVQY